MPTRIQDAGTLRTITRGRVMSGGVMRELQTIKVQDGGSLRTVAKFTSDLAVAAPGISVFGNASTLVTGDVVATATGGFAPYSYAWSLQTNGGGTASTASAPAQATTKFTKTNIPPETEYTDIWRVTVTDALGDTAQASAAISFLNLTGA